jgi:hypothetical protein
MSFSGSSFCAPSRHVAVVSCVGMLNPCLGGEEAFPASSWATLFHLEHPYTFEVFGTKQTHHTLENSLP